MEIVAYDPQWLPQLASLARAHARLAAPHLVPSDEEVAAGLERHRYWRFYTSGIETAQTLLAVHNGELLAAAQAGFAGYGWGYGAAPSDGPDWLHEVHCSLFWLFAWPGWDDAIDASAHLVAAIVGWARREGLPGIEAFRGGPGFLAFGTQLSSRWPHLWAPLRACGFRQPRDLLVFGGATEPEALPLVEYPRALTFSRRQGRSEAWLDGEIVGLCTTQPLGGRRREAGDARGADTPPATDCAAIRRLVVEPAMRGRGIGSALLAEELRRLHRRGIPRYVLHIPDTPDDWAAKQLYGKFGTVLERQQVLRLSF